MSLASRLPSDEVVRPLAVFRDNEALRTHLASIENAEVRTLGASRSGQDLFGVTIGKGSTPVSVIAGSHADEPVGPMTAQALPILLSQFFPELLDRFRFRIVPQMNPDGADRNRSWFREPLDFGRYVEHVVRELPGDDIEFGFGTGEWTRPECAAAMTFIEEDGPYAAHFSLHGMAFAEGAWFLICREWLDRIEGIRLDVEGLCADEKAPLHDMDRGGEKGFTRIKRGFCTTPTSYAMKEHFLAQNDGETAAKFRPSSMEFVQSLGGDPICVVSELPLFLLGVQSESLEESVYSAFREDLTRARALEHYQGASELNALESKYRLSPMPPTLQIRLQLGLIAAVLTNLP